MDSVDGEMRVMPVDHGMIEADFESFGAEGFDQGLDQVAASRGVGGLVVSELGVPEAEALVVLGGDDDVLHAGLSGELRPFAGIIQVWVKVAQVLVILFIEDGFTVLHPFVPRREGRTGPQWMNMPKRSCTNQLMSPWTGAGGGNGSHGGTFLKNVV